METKLLKLHGQYDSPTAEIFYMHAHEAVIAASSCVDGAEITNWVDGNSEWFV